MKWKVHTHISFVWLKWSLPSPLHFHCQLLLATGWMLCICSSSFSSQPRLPHLRPSNQESQNLPTHLCHTRSAKPAIITDDIKEWAGKKQSHVHLGQDLYPCTVPCHQSFQPSQVIALLVGSRAVLFQQTQKPERSKCWKSVDVCILIRILLHVSRGSW